MLNSSHLGDRPLLLWSMALGMLGIAYAVSFSGMAPTEEFTTAFFRWPFIMGLVLATFVMGFVRPEMKRTWTIGMGGAPAVIVFAVAQIRILLTPEHSAGTLWPLAMALVLALGISLAFSGSSLGARAALRLSPN